MFKFFARLATTQPWAVCAAWLFVGGLAAVCAPSWDSKAQDDDIHFLPARCGSVRGYALLEQAFPRDVFASRMILAVEREDGALRDADFRLVDRLADAAAALGRDEPGLQIGSVASYRDGLIGKRLTSADGRCTLVQISLGTPFLAVQTRTTVNRLESRLHDLVGPAWPKHLHVFTTGPAGLGRDLTEASARSLEGTTLATVLLVIVVLLLVYRAPLLALIPLATIAASVWVALHLLALLTLIPGVHLVNISKVFAVVILYGAGTDYCLFLISRYREELIRDGHVGRAIRRSVRGVGGALAASAGTVICGLGMMGFAEFAKVRCAGPAIALSLAVGLLAALSLTPALLRILGKKVFWPGVAPTVEAIQPRTAGPEPFWDRIGRAVVARPVWIWAVAVGGLLPLAILGLRISPSYKSAGELPPWSQSVRGAKAIQQHFTAGEIGPATILLESEADWNSPAGRELIAHLSRGFALLPEVAEVRSLTQPLGSVVRFPETLSVAPQGALGKVFQALRQGVDAVYQQAERAACAYYVARLRNDAGERNVTRIDVVFRPDPFDGVSTETLRLIETWLREELPLSARDFGPVRAETYGVTASARDLAEVTEADRTRINLLVSAGVLLILLVLVRRPVLAIYLLATVLFSYYATLGATVLVGHCWAGRPLDTVEWRVPFFLFTILVAVGEDYNILLITRVLHETRRRGRHEGIRWALARTGGTITSCGVIMAGTFATLMVGGLGTLVQIGFALAFGVLLDTFIVRPLLVPAFLAMIWRGAEPAGRTQRTSAAVPTRLAG